MVHIHTVTASSQCKIVSDLMLHGFKSFTRISQLLRHDRSVSRDDYRRAPPSWASGALKIVTWLSLSPYVRRPYVCTPSPIPWKIREVTIGTSLILWLIDSYQNKVYINHIAGSGQGLIEVAVFWNWPLLDRGLKSGYYSGVGREGGNRCEGKKKNSPIVK